MTTAYPNTIIDQFELAAAAGANVAQMSQQLPLLIGKNFYAVGYSKLYKPDTSLEGLTSPQRTLNELPTVDIPRLEPLKILAARYVDSAGIVFMLRLPNGHEAISFTPKGSYLDADSSKPFFERVAGTLKTGIPKSLAQRDIDSIKRHTIYRGMKVSAVYLALGFPDKENDWGRGGKQLIFFDRLFVYLDHDNKVVDLQSLDK